MISINFAPGTTQQPSAQLLCTNLPQEITEDVLSALFQRCVPSSQCIHRSRADHSLDQIPGIADSTSACFPNSQCCRSTGQNGPNLVREPPTGRSGQRKLERVFFEGGLGHDRLIHLIPPLPWRKIIPLFYTPRIRLSVVYNGGIYMVARSLSALVFCEDRVIKFVKGSELLLFNEIELPKVGQVDIGLGPGLFFSLRTSCTNRKKCR